MITVVVFIDSTRKIVRIVLSDTIRDGSFKISLSYVEDCATLPTALAAALLGIGGEALVAPAGRADQRGDPGHDVEIVHQIGHVLRQVLRLSAVRLPPST